MKILEVSAESPEALPPVACALPGCTLRCAASPCHPSSLQVVRLVDVFRAPPRAMLHPLRLLQGCCKFCHLLPSRCYAWSLAISVVPAAVLNYISTTSKSSNSVTTPPRYQQCDDPLCLVPSWLLAKVWNARFCPVVFWLLVPVLAVLGFPGAGYYCYRVLEFSDDTLSGTACCLPTRILPGCPIRGVASLCYPVSTQVVRLVPCIAAEPATVLKYISTTTNP